MTGGKPLPGIGTNPKCRRAPQRGALTRRWVIVPPAAASPRVARKPQPGASGSAAQCAGSAWRLLELLDHRSDLAKRKVGDRFQSRASAKVAEMPNLFFGAMNPLRSDKPSRVIPKRAWG
jgi:hypothetical protein